MSDSPFAPYANAVLYVPVASGETETDAWGNPSPATSEIEIVAILTPASGFDFLASAGLDRAEIPVSGYLVEPKTLPPSVKPPVTCRAVLTAAIDTPVEGQLDLYPVVQSPYLVAMSIAIATEVRGIFRRT